MTNTINELIHDIHHGLSLADHGGDVARHLPKLQELERLIARIPSEPELLEGFDAEGIKARYEADGYVWCKYEGAFVEVDED